VIVLEKNTPDAGGDGGEGIVKNITAKPSPNAIANSAQERPRLSHQRIGAECAWLTLTKGRVRL
jgi:hypothetical protein